jgi:MerR family Zn(II)-responsive transcriptional regulator of zntA
MQNSATIGDASRLTGVSVRTIRFYEQAGLLPPAERTGSGYRLFGPAELRRLRLIRRGRMAGLSLGRVRELVDAAFSQSCGRFEEHLASVVASRLQELDRTIQELQALHVELNAIQLDLQRVPPEAGNCRPDDCEHCRFIDD